MFFVGFQEKKGDKDCYIICFDITASVDGIQYLQKIESIVNKLENTGYLDGIKLPIQKIQGENYAGKRSYF